MKIAVVIPCYKVKAHILKVISDIGLEVSKVYVVDDCCPQESGKYVEEHCHDERVMVLHHPINRGVGGATLTGYRQALEDADVDVVVKMDGDGQMAGASITNLVKPIESGLADYTKGNRFYDLNFLRPMPFMRLVGNCGLSFISKLSSGYWNIMDPTNGFTAIHINVLRALEMDRVEQRYFFESDMLYRLYLLRAVIWDVPMCSVYGDEKSNLVILKAVFEFAYKHVRRLFTRLFYIYFLRDFQIGSLLLLFGLTLLSFGVTFGGYHWYWGHKLQIANPGGTVMLAALPCLVGLQFILTFLNCDLNNIPSRPIHRLLSPSPAHSDDKKLDNP